MPQYSAHYPLGVNLDMKRIRYMLQRVIQYTVHSHASLQQQMHPQKQTETEKHQIATVGICSKRLPLSLPWQNNPYNSQTPDMIHKSGTGGGFSTLICGIGASLGGAS